MAEVDGLSLGGEVTPRFPAVSALLRGSLRAGQVVGGVDQRDVREGLRKVADLAGEARVVLLGEESDVVTQRKQVLEKLAGLLDASLQDEIVGQPKAAGQKCPFSGRQAVHQLSGVVPHDETVDDEALLDCFHRSDDTRVGRRKESDERKQQEARVERL